MENPELFSQQTDMMPAFEALRTSSARRIAVALFPFLAAIVSPAAAVAVGAASTIDALIDQWLQTIQSERRENVERYIMYQLAYLQKQADRVRERLEEVEKRLSEPEFRRILSSYTLEAAREPIDERLKMLAAATAGSANLHLSIGQAARVERKLRELDPDDVKALWIIYRTVGNVDLDGTVHGSPLQLKAKVLARVGTDVLEPGLLRRTWGGFGGSGTIERTELGILVLQILEEYLRERVPDAAIPGRHRRPNDRPSDVVDAIISAHPLTALIDRILTTANDADGRFFLPNTKENAEPFLSVTFRSDAQAEFVESSLANMTDDAEFKIKLDKQEVETMRSSCRRTGCA